MFLFFRYCHLNNHELCLGNGLALVCKSVPSRSAIYYSVREIVRIARHLSFRGVISTKMQIAGIVCHARSCCELEGDAKVKGNVSTDAVTTAINKFFIQERLQPLITLIATSRIYLYDNIRYITPSTPIVANVTT